jgi:hypothetical protein
MIGSERGAFSYLKTFTDFVIDPCFDHSCSFEGRHGFALERPFWQNIVIEFMVRRFYTPAPPNFLMITKTYISLCSFRAYAMATNPITLEN